MSIFGQWAAGSAMAVLALLGVFLFSRATDQMFTAFAALLFLFGIAGVIGLVHQATDYSSSDEHESSGHASTGEAGQGEGGKAS